MHTAGQSYDTDIGRLTPLAQGSLAEFVGFRHHDHPHRDPDDEVFTRPTIIFTLQGAWHLRSQREDVRVDPDVIVMGRSGQHYRCRHLESIPTDVNAALHFNEERLAELLARDDPDGLLKPLASGIRAGAAVARRTSAISRLQYAFFEESAHKTPGHSLRVDQLAVELLVEVARQLGGAVPNPCPSPEPRNRDGVEAARAYMALHLDEAIGLDALARVAGLSPFHFSRVFRETVGTSPHQYLVRMRIEQAKHLLSASDLPVTEICFAVGFHSLSHFITTFRTSTGRTPQQYRRG